jgi:drug/metabolite transporter (DMT)-like permease
VVSILSDKHNYRLGFWLAVGAAFGFSAKAIFVKLAYMVPSGGISAGHVDAVTLLALRMLFAAPVFAFAALRSTSPQPLARRQILTLVGIGLAGYYGASMFDFWGLMYISAGLERLILFTYPSLTLLIGIVFLGERLHRRELVALLITYTGIAAAFTHDLHLAADTRTAWFGVVLVFASSLSYAIYLAGSGALIARLGSLRFTALAMVIATSAVLLHYVLARPMAMFSTVIPVFMQSAAIRIIGAGRASMIGMLGPMATIGMSWSLLGEAISVWQIGGSLMVIAGVALISRK